MASLNLPRKPDPMRSSLVVLTAALALTLPLSGPALAQEAAAPTETAAPGALPAITVTTVSQRVLKDHVIASGLIGPVEQVFVPPLIEGQPIEALLADVGDRVQAGQVLARLSTATLELQKSQLLAQEASVKAAIAQAQAQLTNAETNAAEAAKAAQRSAELFQQGRVSLAANDQAQAASVSAAAQVTVATQGLASARAQEDLMRAQLANIDLNLSRTEVVAPVDGVISARNAQLGAIASSQGQPLFVLIRDGALELAADVAEVDLARVAPGQEVTLTLASGGDPVKGKVRLVEPTIDTQSRLGRARIWIEDSSAVRSGMFAEADILVTVHDALAVPVTAVSSSASGETTVMLVEDGTAKRQVIETGIRDGGWIEVSAGLTAGQTVVTKAGSFVRDGEKVNPIAEASTN